MYRLNPDHMGRSYRDDALVEKEFLLPASRNSSFPSAINATVASVGLIFAATLSIGLRTLFGPVTWLVFAVTLVMMTLLKWNQLLSLLIAF